MPIEAQLTTKADNAGDAKDSSIQPDRLHDVLMSPTDVRSEIKPSLPATLPAAFGNFAISDSASCKADDQPKVTVSNEAQGTIVDKLWCNGDEEFDHADGSKVTFKSDKNGGEINVLTSPDGSQSTGHTYPDGKGGAIVENKNDALPGDNFTAYYNKDGSMKVDWKDGRHMDRYTDQNGAVHTTMTGKEARDNYTATESKFSLDTRVNYADGSSYVMQADGKVEAKGRPSRWGIMDAWTKSASDFHLSTEAQLIGAFWIGKSKTAHDVMKMKSN